MKVLRNVLLVILALVLVLFVITLFLPNQKVVERTLVIKASQKAVFSLVNDLKSWEKWSPWYAIDTTAELAYSDPASGEGAWYTWKSENSDLGTGKLTITGSYAYDSLHIGLTFGEWKPSPAYYYFENTGDGNTRMRVKMPMDAAGNPLFKLMQVFMAGKLAEMFDKGMENIRTIAEAMPAEPAVSYTMEGPSKEAMTGFHYGFISLSCPSDSIQGYMQSAATELMVLLASKNAEVNGEIFAVYQSYEPGGTTQMDVAFPVKAAVKAEGKLKAGEMKDGQVVKLIFRGNPAESGAGHEAIDGYLKANNLTPTGAPWEVYSNMESDPKVTICYPVN